MCWKIIILPVLNCSLMLWALLILFNLKTFILVIDLKQLNPFLPCAWVLLADPGEASRAALQTPPSFIHWTSWPALVQTGKIRKGLSWKTCPREAPSVISSPEGKSDYPRDLPRANLSNNPWGLITVCQTLGFKNRRRCGTELPHGLVQRNSGCGLAQVWQC